MKRILGTAMVLGLMGVLTVIVGCSKAKVDVVDFGEGVKLEMVLVPVGKFVMGSPESEKKRRNNERQHEVILTKPYYMGKYEVTQEQYEAVMGKNPSTIKGARLPVTDVSWYDCQEFIKKLNAKTDGGYRLPSESEWEYACRAGTTTAYSFGDKITPKDANYQESKAGKPEAVGSYKPNVFGLYDMHGNVWEWCDEPKVDYPKETVTDPNEPETVDFSIMRGGSYATIDSGTRSSIRLKWMSPESLDTLGFRLAKDK